jgi:prepilin-type N-terminal cleavage/methylation domain-containing protein
MHMRPNLHPRPFGARHEKTSFSSLLPFRALPCHSLHTARQMYAQSPTRDESGFTLIEVLASLGLCALLATATASAIVFSARTELAAARDGEATLLVQSLYAAQRLRPDDPPSVPRGWRVEDATEIVKFSDDLLQEWHLIALAAEGREIPPFTLRILGDKP